jgi:hypothetical protein
MVKVGGDLTKVTESEFTVNVGFHQCGLRHFSIIARTLVNSCEFTVNLLNLAYLCLSSGFGSRCLLLLCFLLL